MNLYHDYFTPAERRALAAFPATGIESEIHLLRVLLRRSLSPDVVPAHGLKSHLVGLRARANAAGLIACLLRTHLLTHHPSSEVDEAIERIFRLIEGAPRP